MLRLPSIPAASTASTIIALVALGIAGQAHPATVADAKPNVVMILADDLGWSDTTLFGTTKFYRTPNIQRLAKRGMTFSRAYSSSPLCSPTRASILTGTSPARHGITSPTCHLPKVVLEPAAKSSGPPHQMATVVESVTRLKTDYYTLAEMFRDNGYATGHFGKWHLGPEPYSPLQHGFDVDVPHFAGPGPAGGYVAPWNYDDFDPDPDTPDQHIEDRMAKEAEAFMDQNADRPFFLNYWMFSVHAPFDAKQTLIEKYRHAVDPDGPQRSPTYAAMIESMDDAVGTLLDALDRLGIADNTIIVFASDNGGNMYNEVDGTTPTSNAPLRGGKATMYEGGIRGPAIVVQPGVIEAGSTSDQTIQSSDYYPTLLDLLNIDPQPGQQFDGISLVPALKGGKLDREAIFTYFPHSPAIPDWLPPSASVHQGDWKLIRIFHGGKNESHRYKLFNLREDLGEQDNLAEKFPERVRHLDALIEQHLLDTSAVRPRPNPSFEPTRYDITREGKAELKGGTKKPEPRKRRPAGQPVAGWQPGGTCKLSHPKGVLRVASTGGDPYLSYPLDQPIPASKLKLRLRMKSNSSGRGQFFWRDGRQPFSASRSQPFEVMHDGQVHDYRIDFSPTTEVHSIRIDPSRGNGVIELLEVVLINDDNLIIHQWNF
ncbi:sulfatase [Roseiconus nitratireducens]|nr:sulfatase [Roseiconus nitratireducens]